MVRFHYKSRREGDRTRDFPSSMFKHVQCSPSYSERIRIASNPQVKVALKESDVVLHLY